MLSGGREIKTRTSLRLHCDLGSHRVRNYFTNIALSQMQDEVSSSNFVLKYVRSS
jgi:hypothetical protein